MKIDRSVWGSEIILIEMDVEILSIEYLDDISNGMVWSDKQKIMKLIGMLRSVCDDCRCVRYYPLLDWQGRKLCQDCINALRAEISDIIHKYVTEKGYTACKFCGKYRDSVSGFHYDHLNMFDKRESVGTMIRRGDDVEAIKAEIDKCQLLCISCHSIITEIEKQFGFIRKKTRLTKKGGDCRKLYDEYEAFMKECYEFVAETVRRGGIGE